MAHTKQETAFTGLTNKEVLESREKFGMNLLTPPKRPSMWKLYLEKFRDPVIRILLVAAFFSLVIAIIEDEYAETIGIFFAIFLATGIGFYFEYDANKKFDLLNAVGEETPVTVMRNGKIQEIPRKDIVVGDIVILNTGEEVPADGILLEAISMQINESNLTGELMVNKTVNEELFDDEATYPSNTVMRGTTVVDGHGMMRVEHVGDATEIGKVARQATEQSQEQTPLNIQLTKLADFIGKIGFTIATLTFIIFTAKDLYGYLSMNEITGWQQWVHIARIVLKYFMMAVTLIVVAVPEGLPMSVTLSLALNMRRMLKTNNLVRKMHACETMGATTVICTDKTGTLTQNQMQVYQTNFYALAEQKLGQDEMSVLVKEGISMNSTAFLDYTFPEKIKTLGNPTEAALLLWLHGQQVNYMDYREHTEIAEQLTFSTERKYMATLVKSSLGGKLILYVKGAPEILLSKCKDIRLPEGHKPIPEYQATIEEQLLAYQNKAMRTLGFAYKELSPEHSDLETEASSGLTFLGIAAIADPVRPDVPAAVAKCLNAGINVKIVTGDTPATAREIGRQIGIWESGDTEEQIITGTDFEKLTDEEAAKRVLKLKIMCRARPTDKQRLVELLKHSGAVVAVTGDGTNDAPALNHADVGLSMGTGTSVAKEASDITLLDDSFNSIATAVMWGRSLYHNIQRFILFQLTINLSALLIVLLGSLLGHQLPLTVTQMLWVNMIIDTFAAGALASLPPNPNVMNEKPRKPSDFIITRKMQHHILGIGITFTVLLLGMMYYFTNEQGDISRYDLSIFFTTFVMLQFWNMFNAKAFMSGGSAFRNLKESAGFLIVMLIIPIGQFLIVEFGGDVFRTVPLTLRDWGIIVGATSLVLWIGELMRLLKK